MPKSTPTDAIDEIVRRLVEGMDPEQIILFGSYAYGEPTPSSDVDLIVVLDRLAVPPHRKEQEAYTYLQGLRTPVDLLVSTREELDRRATVATSLARVVADRGKVLYDRREARRDRELAHEGPA